MVSSRTPEGWPAHCTLCGAATNLEPSHPADDVPCPACGHLLFLSADLLEVFRERFSVELAADSPLASSGLDSLDMVELLMDIEEQYDISIPGEGAAGLHTVGDAIRFILGQRSK